MEKKRKLVYWRWKAPTPRKLRKIGKIIGGVGTAISTSLVVGDFVVLGVCALVLSIISIILVEGFTEEEHEEHNCQV